MSIGTCDNVKEKMQTGDMGNVEQSFEEREREREEEDLIDCRSREFQRAVVVGIKEDCMDSVQKMGL